MDALKTEFQFYIDNQKELVEKYDGKFIVIKGEEVLGDYDDEDTAIIEALKEHKPGTFMVHKVGPGKENYTQTFRSRVVI